MSVLQIFCQEKRTFESPSIEQAQRFSYHFVKIWNRSDRHSNIISNFASLQKFELKILQNKFSCPHCPMVMKTSTLIKRHILIHTGEKPFSCEFCQYSANRKEHLKSHNFSKHNVVLWTINISSFEIKLHFFWILKALINRQFLQIVCRKPQFILVINNMVVRFVKRSWKITEIWEDTLWFILERNRSIVYFVHTLAIENFS